MLKRFKATLYLTASALAFGVLFYFVALWFTGSVGPALMFSAVPVAGLVPLIGVFALVAIRPADNGEIAEDDAGFRRHVAIATGGYAVSYLPLMIGAVSLLTGRTGLAATLLGVYVLMAFLPLRSALRVRRTLEYRASQR